jgi:hypothetical protein
MIINEETVNSDKIELQYNLSNENLATVIDYLSKIIESAELRKKLGWRCNPEDLKAFADKYKEIAEEGSNLRHFLNL